MGSRLQGRAACTTTILTLAVVAAGCYWTKYDKLVRTHVDVLLAMTTKIEDVTRSRGAAPPSLGEYRYPLERARDFARIAARRFAGRESLVALDALCDDYARLIEAVERLRVQRGDDGAERAVREAAAATRTRGAAVLAALDRERGA